MQVIQHEATHNQPQSPAKTPTDGFDVTVIGGGLAGTAAAIHLSWKSGELRTLANRKQNRFFHRRKTKVKKSNGEEVDYRPVCSKSFICLNNFRKAFPL